MISAAFPYQKKRQEVLGHMMAYEDLPDETGQAITSWLQTLQ